MAYSSITNKDMAEWLFDLNRANGDTTIIESDTGYYVVFMMGRYQTTITRSMCAYTCRFEIDEGASEPLPSRRKPQSSPPKPS